MKIISLWTLILVLIAAGCATPNFSPLPEPKVKPAPTDTAVILTPVVLKPFSSTDLVPGPTPQIQKLYSIELVWSPANDDSIIGYGLYYWTNSALTWHEQVVDASTNYFGTNCTAIFTGLCSTNQYWFTITTIDFMGIESDYGDEIQIPPTLTNVIHLQANLLMSTNSGDSWLTMPNVLNVQYTNVTGNAFYRSKIGLNWVTNNVSVTTAFEKTTDFKSWVELPFHSAFTLQNMPTDTQFSSTVEYYKTSNFRPYSLKTLTNVPPTIPIFNL